MRKKMRGTTAGSTGSRTGVPKAQEAAEISQACYSSAATEFQYTEYRTIPCTELKYACMVGEILLSMNSSVIAAPTHRCLLPLRGTGSRTGVPKAQEAAEISHACYSSAAAEFQYTEGRTIPCTDLKCACKVGKVVLSMNSGDIPAPTHRCLLPLRGTGSRTGGTRDKENAGHHSG